MWLIQIIFNKLIGSMSNKGDSIYSNPDVAKISSAIHDTFIVVPAEKAQNKIILSAKPFIYNF